MRRRTELMFQVVTVKRMHRLIVERVVPEQARELDVRGRALSMIARVNATMPCHPGRESRSDSESAEWALAFAATSRDPGCEHLDRLRREGHEVGPPSRREPPEAV